MFYKIRNILCMSALALLLNFAYGEVQAQGLVTLAADADSGDALNKDIPDEISLFDEDSSGLDELGISPPKKAASDAENALPSSADPLNTGMMKGPLPADPLNTGMMKGPLPNGSEAPTVLGTENENSQTFGAPTPFSGSSLGALQAPENADTNNGDLNGSNPLMANPLLGNSGGGVGALGSDEFTPIDDKVFSQMSDLEKQTALLNLELRREKVKNEIEAIKNQRKVAIEQEKEKEEQKARQKIEWEKAQEAKVLEEQQKLRELDIRFEKMRQERLLNSYKNKMLEDNQKWIANYGDVYKQIGEQKKQQQDLLDTTKARFSSIRSSVLANVSRVQEAKRAYQREIADLQTQISILKARIDAQEKEMEKQNPFAEDGETSAEGTGPTAVSSAVVEPELKLANMYAVMEIRGQGGELVAKLINQEGKPFFVKKGTSLQSGHIVDEITSTYVRADKGGIKDYLYFAAGGILPLEPEKSTIKPDLKESTEKALEELPAVHEFITSDVVPGMGKDMMAR